MNRTRQGFISCKKPCRRPTHPLKSSLLSPKNNLLATNNNHNPSAESLEICTDLKQVARLILRQSFAILQVDKKTHQSLNHAWISASEFLSAAVSAQAANRIKTKASSVASNFAAAPSDDNDDNDDGNDSGDDTPSKPTSHLIDEASFFEYRTISHGNLLGFNRPSSAKVLFRAFCSKWGIENGQPWPPLPPYSSFSLKKCSIDLATKLHVLLVECVDEIQREYKMLELGDNYVNGDKENVVCKRRKLELSSSEHLHDCLPEKELTASSSMGIPRDLQDAGICPLDYFLYHNIKTNNRNYGSSDNVKNDVHDTQEAMEKNTSLVNCSEHVDRGILICICLTDVLGLEVMLPPTTTTEGVTRSGVFVCPEEIAIARSGKFNGKNVGCTDLVCILSGDQLKDVVSTCSMNRLKYDHDRRTLGACVHRVRSNLERERLSITYELRGEAAAN